MLERTIRIIYALMLLSIILVAHLTYSTYQGIVDKKFTILAVERENAITKLQTEAAAVTAQEGNTGEGRKQINKLVRDRREWEPFVFNYYASVEIYPVNPRTGESLFESSITGKFSKDELEYLNTTSYTPELMLVKNHSKVWVYRVTALANIGLNNVTVNADLEVFEIVKRYANRWIELAALLALLGLIVFYARKLQGSARRDNRNSSDEAMHRARIIEEALEALDIGVVIAEPISSTENRIIHASRKFHREFGWPSGDLAGRNLEVFLPPSKQEAHANMVWDFLQGDEDITRRQVVAVDKKGNPKETNLHVGKTDYVWDKKYVAASVRAGGT